MGKEGTRTRVSTQWKRVLGTFPHNGNMFPEFFHTMEAGFEGFSIQWKPVLGKVSTVWKSAKFFVFSSKLTSK
jgi:hypothetical protein